MKLVSGILAGVLLAASAICAAEQPTSGTASSDAWRATMLKTAEETQAAGRMALAGSDGWIYFVPELRHLAVGQFWGAEAAKVSRATKPEWADPLPAIVDFNTQLKRAGIELIVVPVPAKAAVYPQNLPENIRPTLAAGQRLDSAHTDFYKLLAEQGVKVLDLTPVFTEGSNGKAPLPGPLYCKQDTHWSGSACVLTAQKLAEQIKALPWYAGVEKTKFTAQWRKQTITGDLYNMLGDTDATRAKESLDLRFITAPDGAAFEPWRESPVLLVGDSHTLIFHSGDDMQAVGAGLLEQLAMELGFAPDLVGVRGSGATPSRIALMRRGDSLAGKKFVIWTFSVREFTEGQGWRKVPVVR